MEYIDVETIAEMDLKALYIMDFLKYGVKHIVVKHQTLAAVGIRAEMQFLACFVSLGKYSVLCMHILHFVLSRDFRRMGSGSCQFLLCSI